MFKTHKKIILSIFAILIGLLAGWGLFVAKQHYEAKENAFYYAYKNHESLYKQQKAFFENIESAELEDMHVDYNAKGWMEGGPSIDSITFKDKVYEIKFFSPDNAFDDDETFDFWFYSRNPKSEKEEPLCEIKLNKKMEITDVEGSDKAHAERYKQKALKVYRQIFKEYYDYFQMRSFWSSWYFIGIIFLAGLIVGLILIGVVSFKLTMKFL